MTSFTTLAIGSKTAFKSSSTTTDHFSALQIAGGQKLIVAFFCDVRGVWVFLVGQTKFLICQTQTGTLST